jgi:hypothetical protein
MQQIQCRRRPTRWWRTWRIPSPMPLASSKKPTETSRKKKISVSSFWGPPPLMLVIEKLWEMLGVQIVV